MAYYQIIEDHLSDFCITDEPTLVTANYANRGIYAGMHWDKIFEPWTVIFNGPEDQQPPHFMGINPPIVSKEFLDTLSEAGADNIQFCKAKLVHKKTGLSYEDRYALNVIGVEDHKHASLHIFRHLQDPGALIIDEQVKEALAKNRPQEGWGIMIFDEADPEFLR